MRCTDIYIAGTGAHIPPATSVAEAVASGAFSAEAYGKTRQISLATAGSDEHARDFAIAASREALEYSGHGAGDLGSIFYAVAFDPHHIPGSNDASYIQGALGASGGFVSRVDIGCAGGVGCVELAASFLETHGESPAALVVAGDQWPMPYANRWQADPSIQLGDGAGAWVLSSERGFARLASVATHTDPSLEGFGRGNETGPQYPVDFGRRYKAFLKGFGSTEDFWQAVSNGLLVATNRALDHAGATMKDIQQVAYSFVPHPLMAVQCLKPLGIDVSRTTWDWGRRIGHIGPADALIGYHRLAQAGRLRAGDRALVIGVGSGFVWTVAVVETLTA